MKNFVQYQLPALVWMVVIFILSSMHQSSFPVIDIPHIDKVVHICIFFILGATIDRAILHQTHFLSLKRYHLFATVIIVMLYGLSDEFHQIYVPTRTADILDATADTIGGILFVIYFVIRKLRTK